MEKRNQPCSRNKTSNKTNKSSKGKRRHKRRSNCRRKTNFIFFLEEYELLMKQHQNTMNLIEKLTMQIPGVKEILKIKGVGLKTLSGFIAEVGDIERFDHPKKVQKLAGLNLKENSSGKHKGQTTITKRGRKRLRSILFSTIMPIVAKNKEFQQLHKYYTTRKENPLKKKQSLIVLCCKLIRVFFVILKNRCKI